MATRAERLQQRIRGAGHGQVAGMAFELDLEGDATSSEPSSEAPSADKIAEDTPVRTRSTPNTSAKRRRLESDGPPPYALQNVPATAVEPLPPAPSKSPNARRSSRRGSATADSQPKETTIVAPPTSPRAEEQDDIALLPPAAPPSAPASTKSPARRAAGSANEEVEESPMEAPGTGRRRKVATDGASSSSRRLQQVISAAENESDVDPLSSPLEQRSRRARTRDATGSGSKSERLEVSQAEAENDADPLSSPVDQRVQRAKSGATRRSVMLQPRSSSLGPEAEQPDEILPEQTPPPRSSQTRASPELSSRADLGSNVPALEPGPEEEEREQQEQQENHIDEEQDNVPEAQESHVEAAVKRPGRKRTRRGVDKPQPEPEVAPEPEPAEEEEDEAEEAQPTRKRHRKATKSSPAKQKQGRPRNATSKTKPKTKPPKSVPREPSPLESRQDADGAIEILSQRFTKRRKLAEDADPDFDIISAEIPFAKRAGVNSIDVLASVCDEIIHNVLDRLDASRGEALDRAAKKELRTKTNALRAYQSELTHRLLEHAILVDHMHSLRQRVKAEQREKGSLRDEIMQLRAEREQVAIRKDALRAKHEKERDECLHRLNLSSAMHDIDLAVERGRTAPELTLAQEKKAKLADLELLVARVSDRSCSRSDAGGALGQLREFNAFLERAAVALEGR